jgi:transcriptional regulator with XRE-family HTH domain
MKRCRDILGLSQMALAERVGCSTTLIGNIEIKKRFPSAENIDRIAKALEVSPADLFAETEPQVISVMASKQFLKTQLEQRFSSMLNELLMDK